jgi:hypothetical protein
VFCGERVERATNGTLKDHQDVAESEPTTGMINNVSM